MTKRTALFLLLYGFAAAVPGYAGSWGPSGAAGSFFTPLKDSILPVLYGAGYKEPSILFPLAVQPFITLLENKQPARGVLGYTRRNRPVAAWFFPGRSNKRAVVIGGMHGSELSSIEVVNRVRELLSATEAPYYNVLVIPVLFPDNAATALQHEQQIGSTKNIGRYTASDKADPNRQMPYLGRALDEDVPLDAAGRPVERENQYLLRLINDFRPHRIVNVHAIRDVLKAGVFADPRTDCRGLALGYETDSLLALSMAQHIRIAGGEVGGNALEQHPQTRYFNDPPIAVQGHHQPRNLVGSFLPNNLGQGVSLGAWASTAVCDSLGAEKDRPAIRLITVEFPGYKRTVDYEGMERQKCAGNVEAYAASIIRIFLRNYFTEENQ